MQLTGAERIALERMRQLTDEGWTAAHDSQYDKSELIRAAIEYATAAMMESPPVRTSGWPWHPSWWKPSSDPIRNLEKAGALIAAEIDRLGTP